MAFDWLVVGLGNPGAEYVGTRHNVGFEVIDELASRCGISVRRRAMRCVLGDGSIGGRRVILAKPMTYMNLSGEGVGAVSRMYQIPAERVLVVVDDTALPVGRIRLRPKGSSGGHNGLKSIQAHLHTTEYPRIRIGVGSVVGERMVGHVLGRFDRSERETISDAVDTAADAVAFAVEHGWDLAMNRFNL
jgi:PTH1 family peptidyl-tRNA hydrolase